MNPLLVYLDPAEDNVPVLAKAKYLAERLQAPVVLFAAVFDPNLAKRSPFDAGDSDQAIHAYLKKQEQDLEHHAATLQSSGVAVSVRVTWNKSPWQGINSLRQDQEFDLIIKGTHHQNVVQRTFFSSTDWDLMRCSPLPVLLVKRSTWPETGMQLTACVDPIGQENQAPILDRAIVMQAKAWQDALQGKLQVLNVYDPTPFIVYMDPPVPDTTPITEALLEQHQDALDNLLDSSGLPKSAGRLEAGTPASAIPELLEDNHTHLVVMGAQTREGLNRWLIGHTAEKILDRISCDILVIKTDQAGN